MNEVVDKVLGTTLGILTISFLVLAVYSIGYISYYITFQDKERSSCQNLGIKTGKQVAYLENQGCFVKDDGIWHKRDEWESNNLDYLILNK
jgi:hypothetical protein